MTVVLNARLDVVPHHTPAIDAPFSAQLTQLAETVGTLLGARKVTLTSQRRGSAPHCHIAWRPEPAPAYPRTLDRTNIFEPNQAPAVVRESAMKATGHHVSTSLGTFSGREWRLTAEHEAVAPSLTDAQIRATTLMFEAFNTSFVLWRRLQAKTQRLAAMEALAHATNHALILINCDMSVVFANRRAEALLTDGSGLIRSQTRLSARVFDDTVRLNSALHFVLRGRGDGLDLDTPNPLITIRRTGAPRLLVGIVPVSPLSPAGSAAMAALYIVDPALDFSDAVEHLCQLYGLTQAETRLAKHLVCGLTLADAATKMKIQLQTARGYLKQIFSKLEISRQADLIRLLMASIVPLRARCLSVAP